MKILLLGIAFLAATAFCQEDTYHPVLAYGIVRPYDGDDSAEEFILPDDDEFQVTQSDRCDGQRFRRCLQSYADDLDIPEIPKDSMAFVRQLTRIIRDQGLAGFKKECRAGKSLKTCLGQKYDKCISEEYLKSIGVEEVDAKVFVTMSVQMTYQCTQGFDAIVNNWECIQSVEQRHRRDFEQCQSDYARKVADDPTNICKYTQDMVNCMTTPFKQQCPPVVYGVFCHSMQVAITTTLPRCSIICTKGLRDIQDAQASSKGRVQTVSSFLARVLTENIPARQFVAFRTRTWSLTAPECDDRRFKKCAHQFVRDVGLASFPGRATALAAYMNQLIATRRAAGFEQVCTAVKNMSRCLGDQMDACFDAKRLERLGLPVTDILIYRQLQQAFISECGTGYDVIHKNIDCMLDCSERHQSEMFRCATEFERSIERDPTNVCKYAQTYLRCNIGMLEQGCGAELGAAICDAMHAELLVPLPQCKQLTCTPAADIALIESDHAILTSHRAPMLVEALGESMPVSALRLQSQDDESDEEDEDDDDDDINAAKCNDKRFGQCLKTYAQQLGLRSFPADPAEFARSLQTILAKYGKIGFKKICLSGGKFMKCLGRQQVNACINITHFMELGLTKEQALTWYVIHEALQFECTKGFRVLYNNFDCILDVSKRANQTFIKCGQDFMKKIKQDPKNVCKYSQQLVNCDVKPFNDRCKREVGYTICQVLQVELKPLLPKCQIKCKREESDESIQDDEMIDQD